MTDRKLRMMAYTAITTATTYSSDVLDTGVADSNLGYGNMAKVVAEVAVAMAGGTSLKVALEHCDTEGGTYVTLCESPVILTASLVAGLRLLEYGLNCQHERYLRFTFTSVGTHSAGGVKARIEMDSI